MSDQQTNHMSDGIGRSFCAKRLIACLAIAVIGLSATPATAQDCHPSYEGECVPIASDVYCAGGSGNGPEYIVGPVQVVRPDVCGLDRDHDGIGCE